MRKNAETRAAENRPFETTSIHLAAALLVQVQDAILAHVTSDPSIDGKRLIVVAYPPVQESTVQQIVTDFHSRRLVVSLYPYNRALNALRDRLKQGEGCHAP